MGDTIVSPRKQCADALGISPNRLSELVQLGVIQTASDDPLAFPRDHAKRNYEDYQFFLKYRQKGERYAAPE